MDCGDMERLVDEIKSIMSGARQRVAGNVNTIMLATYWEVGRTIVESEQNGVLKAQYGKRIISELSKRLTIELGKGYSKSNLYNMRDFYTTYPKFQMPSGKLSWSHYIELSSVKDLDARSFYEHESS